MLWAIFFGHSAVSSSSQSMILASRPKVQLLTPASRAHIAHLEFEATFPGVGLKGD